jgi:peptidoglycan/LPS O-acetylase OafA/YrhL
MNLKMAYRPDIDGLRAIAIVSVLLYHTGVRSFSGGFIGVDVFFVISGYLITNMIVKEINADKFSLTGFYERRIRRIFPALFVVLAFTLLVSAYLFNGNNYLNVRQSAIYTTLFTSNFLFWSQTGYFDQPSTLKPLLHTWSLAVEEQFYIFFPLLMLVLSRFYKSKIRVVLILAALASFLLSVYSVSHDSSAAFYLTYSRVWELLLGSMLAMEIIPANKSSWLSNALGLTGLVLILASVFLYTQDTPFPGFAAIPPTLGSALIIYAGNGERALVNRILGLRPIVFIGQISYSLYLWHWPLIVFGRYYVIREPTALDIIFWILLSILISTLSWRFVERPFRTRGFLNKARIFALAGVTVCLMLLTANFVDLNHYLNSAQAADISRQDAEWKKWKRCGVNIDSAPENLTYCKIGLKKQSPTFLLWGDSHAQAIAPAIDAAASKEKAAGNFIFADACPPLLGIDRPKRETCYLFNNDVMNYVRLHPELRTIILDARWAISATGSRYKQEEGISVGLVDIESGSNQTGENAALFDLGLNRTVQELIELGRNVVIISQVPEVGYDVPSANSIALRTGRNVNDVIAPTLDEYMRRNRVTNASIDSISQKYNIQVIYPSSVLCDKYKCFVAMDGKSLYRDDDHLSSFGAHYISYIFEPLFSNISASP